MLKNSIRFVLFLFALVLGSSVASAQGVIRFIASYGSDANPCTRTQPCRTMQAGVTATPDGGELQVIDSVVTNNTIGLQSQGPFISLGNNMVDGNTTNTAGPITILGPS